MSIEQIRRNLIALTKGRITETDLRLASADYRQIPGIAERYNVNARLMMGGLPAIPTTPISEIITIETPAPAENLKDVSQKILAGETVEPAVIRTASDNQITLDNQLIDSARSDAFSRRNQRAYFEDIINMVDSPSKKPSALDYHKIGKSSKIVFQYGNGDAQFVAFDIQNFKDLNTRYGHEGGNIILTETQQLIKERLITWRGENAYSFTESFVKSADFKNELSKRIGQLNVIDLANGKVSGTELVPVDKIQFYAGFSERFNVNSLKGLSASDKLVQLQKYNDEALFAGKTAQIVDIGKDNYGTSIRQYGSQVEKDMVKVNLGNPDVIKKEYDFFGEIITDPAIKGIEAERTVQEKNLEQLVSQGRYDEIPDVYDKINSLNQKIIENTMLTRDYFLNGNENFKNTVNELLVSGGNEKLARAFVIGGDELGFVVSGDGKLRLSRIDINFFSEFNAKFGTQEADLVKGEILRIIENTIEKPEATAMSDRDIATQIISEVSKLPYEFEVEYNTKKIITRPTISIGTSIADANVFDSAAKGFSAVESLNKVADLAAETAKAAGKTTQSQGRFIAGDFFSERSVGTQDLAELSANQRTWQSTPQIEMQFEFTKQFDLKDRDRVMVENSRKRASESLAYTEIIFNRRSVISRSYNAMIETNIKDIVPAELAKSKADIVSAMSVYYEYRNLPEVLPETKARLSKLGLDESQINRLVQRVEMGGFKPAETPAPVEAPTGTQVTTPTQEVSEEKIQSAIEDYMAKSGEHLRIAPLAYILRETNPEIYTQVADFYAEKENLENQKKLTENEFSAYHRALLESFSSVDKSLHQEMFDLIKVLNSNQADFLFQNVRFMSQLDISNQRKILDYMGNSENIERAGGIMMLISPALSDISKDMQTNLVNLLVTKKAEDLQDYATIFETLKYADPSVQLEVFESLKKAAEINRGNTIGYSQYILKNAFMGTNPSDHKFVLDELSKKTSPGSYVSELLKLARIRPEFRHDFTVSILSKTSEELKQGALPIWNRIYGAKTTAEFLKAYAPYDSGLSSTHFTGFYSDNEKAIVIDMQKIKQSQDPYNLLREVIVHERTHQWFYLLDPAVRLRTIQAFTERNDWASIKESFYKEYPPYVDAHKNLKGFMKDQAIVTELLSYRASIRENFKPYTMAQIELAGKVQKIITPEMLSAGLNKPITSVAEQAKLIKALPVLDKSQIAMSISNEKPAPAAQPAPVQLKSDVKYFLDKDVADIALVVSGEKPLSFRSFGEGQFIPTANERAILEKNGLKIMELQDVGTIIYNPSKVAEIINVDKSNTAKIEDTLLKTFSENTLRASSAGLLLGYSQEGIGGPTINLYIDNKPRYGFATTSENLGKAIDIMRKNAQILSDVSGQSVEIRYDGKSIESVSPNVEVPAPTTDLRGKVKTILGLTELTAEDKNLILELSDNDLKMLKGTISKSDFKKLEKLMTSIEPAYVSETAGAAVGPSLTERQIAQVQDSIDQFLSSKSFITGKSFSETPMAFIVQGSLLTGFSEFRNRPSDAILNGKEHVSDLDLLVVADNGYWKSLPDNLKILEPVPRTDVISLDNVGLADPGFRDLFEKLDNLNLAGRTDRKISMVIMPLSSFEKNNYFPSKLIVENNIHAQEIISRKEFVARAVEAPSQIKDIIIQESPAEIPLSGEAIVEKPAPTFSIVIPFYNEQRIENSFERRKPFWDKYKDHILFIDDGSTTLDVYNRLKDAGYNIIRYNQNQQKIGSIYAAMQDGKISTDYVFPTDIDTEIDGDLAKSVQYVDEKKLDGATFDMVPENDAGNLLEVMQSIEYKLGNEVKKALGATNKQMVIPGAGGVYKTDVFKQSLADLEERGILKIHEGDDLRITLQTLNLKKQLGYIPTALAVSKTEVPNTIEALAQQRYKWHGGTIQMYQYYSNQMLFSKTRLAELGWLNLYSIISAPAIISNPFSLIYGSLASIAMTATVLEKPTLKEIAAAPLFPIYSLVFNTMTFYAKLAEKAAAFFHPAPVVAPVSQLSSVLSNIDLTQNALEWIVYSDFNPGDQLIAQDKINMIIAAQETGREQLLKSFLNEYNIPAQNFIPLAQSGVTKAQVDALKAAAAAAATPIVAPSAAQTENIANLIKLLKSPIPGQRRDAAWTIGNNGPAAAAAVPELIKLLSDSDSDVRRSVVEALGKIGEPAVPALIVALNDIDLNVGQNAADTLGKIGEPAVPALIESLKDIDSRTRLEGDRVSIDGNDYDVKNHIFIILNKIGPDAQSAVPALIETLKYSMHDATETLNSIIPSLGSSIVEINPSEQGRKVIGEYFSKETETINKNRIYIYVDGLNKNADSLNSITDDAKRWSAIKAVIKQADSDYLAFTGKAFYNEKVDDYSNYVGLLASLDTASDYNYKEDLADIAKELKISAEGKTTADLIKEIDSKIPNVQIKDQYIGSFNFQKRNVELKLPEDYELRLKTTFTGILNSQEVNLDSIKAKIADIESKIDAMDPAYLKEQNIPAGLISQVEKDSAAKENIKRYLYKKIELTPDETNGILLKVAERIDRPLIKKYVSGKLSIDEKNLLIQKLSEAEIALEDELKTLQLSPLFAKLKGSDQWSVVKDIKINLIKINEAKIKAESKIELVFKEKNVLNLLQGKYSGTCFGDYPYDMARKETFVVNILNDKDLAGSVLFAIQNNNLIMIGFDPSEALVSGLDEAKSHEFVDKVMESVDTFASRNNFKLLITDQAGGLSNRGLGNYIISKYADKKIVPVDKMVFQPDFKYAVTSAFEAKQIKPKPITKNVFVPGTDKLSVSSNAQRIDKEMKAYLIANVKDVITSDLMDDAILNQLVLARQEGGRTFDNAKVEIANILESKGLDSVSAAIKANLAVERLRMGTIPAAAAAAATPIVATSQIQSKLAGEKVTAPSAPIIRTLT